MGSREHRAMRVMIVEDDAAIALDLAGLVEGFGHEVVGVAGNAATALDLSERSQPDLALVDIRIAGPADGTEVAVALRERDDVRSLFLTACTDPKTRDRAQASWPLGLISKPVRPADLRAALKIAHGAVEWRLRPAPPACRPGLASS